MDVAGQVANVLPDWFVPRRLLQGIVGLSLSATLRRRHQWQLVVTSPAGGRSSEKAPDPSNLCRSYLVRTSRFRGPKAAPTSSSRMDRPRQIPYSRMADILTLGLRNFGGGWGWTRMEGTRTWWRRRDTENLDTTIWRSHPEFGRVLRFYIMYKLVLSTSNWKKQCQNCFKFWSWPSHDLSRCSSFSSLINLYICMIHTVYGFQLNSMGFIVSHFHEDYRSYNKW